MPKRQPFIVELTGIFGAGFLPGLFKPVTALLEENYDWLDGDQVRKLIANYHVDNEAAKQSNPSRRDQITDLLRKGPNLTDTEWKDLVAALEWADRLFEENLKRYPCNVCFRRGGRLQNYIHLQGTRWEEANISRLQPKLQIFIRADYPAVKQSFEQNREVKRIIAECPELFSPSPERAFELQEEWLQRVKDFPGLVHIERPKPSNEEFANHESARRIVSHTVPFLNLYGLKTILKRRVFISYSRKDELFADQLEEALVQQGIGVWIDKNEILVGDSLIKKITEGISGSQFICVIISSNSLASPWVKEELELAMTRQIESGQIVVLPLVLEPGLELPAFLKGKLYINFSRLSFEEGVQALMKRLKEDKRVFGTSD